MRLSESFWARVGDKMRRGLSYFTTVKVSSKRSVSFDGDLFVNEKDSKSNGDMGPVNTAVYQLDESVGPFVLVNVIKSGDKVLYKMRHLESNTELNVTRQVFNLFFKTHKEHA